MIIHTVDILFSQDFAFYDSYLVIIYPVIWLFYVKHFDHIPVGINIK